MSVNSVSSAVSPKETYTGYTPDAKKTESESASVSATTSKVPESGVIYEHDTTPVQKSTSKIYSPNMNLVNQLKADAQKRTEDLRSLVTQLITGQANAQENPDNIWSFLASGNYTVTEAARKKAEEAISEGGYWSVEETSKRIVDFAKALSGGDPGKIESLRDAFKKGFDQAGTDWGRDLPDISHKTYDATMKLFDDWANESKKTEDPATGSEA